MAYYATDLMNAIGAEFIANHDYPAPVFHARVRPGKRNGEKETGTAARSELCYAPG